MLAWAALQHFLQDGCLVYILTTTVEAGLQATLISQSFVLPNLRRKSSRPICLPSDLFEAIIKSATGISPVEQRLVYGLQVLEDQDVLEGVLPLQARKRGYRWLSTNPPQGNNMGGSSK